jgi:predicted nucleic acid-binding protein
MRIYLDSNVLISSIKQEIGKDYRLLFFQAETFFEKILKEKHTLVLSALFFDEVQQKIPFSKEELLEFFSEKKIKFEVVPTEMQLHCFI